MYRRPFVLGTIFIAGCMSSERRIPEVRIAVGGRAALDFIPIYLASSLGFCRQEGVSVTIQDLASTPKALQALLGGSSDMVVGMYDGALQMSLEGKSVQSIAILERWPPFGLVVGTRATEVRTIADLKGKLIGVASPGSSTHRFLNYLLARNGLKPEDVKAVGVGVNFSMAAALRHGQVDAAIAGPLGMALLSKNANMSVLADCRTASGAEAVLGTSNLPAGALMIVPKWARAHSDAVNRVGRATRRALAWIRTHTAQEISDAMPQEHKGEDPGVYRTAVRDIQSAFSAEGLMPPDGPEHVLEMLQVTDGRAGTTRIDLLATYTNEFIRDTRSISDH
jgi:NitT/TauT family transport system substrate-binding protein